MRSPRRSGSRRSGSRRSRALGLVGALGAASVLITGCAPDDDPAQLASPGITAEAVTLGMSTALSGPGEPRGSCAAAGLEAYLEARNAQGGFPFGDGRTRLVDLIHLDDADDPERALANFRRLINEGMFAYVAAPGVATNLAIRRTANEERIPQVLLLTAADALAGDPATFPWTRGLLPTLAEEATAFGGFLAAASEPMTVAVLAPEGIVEDLADALATSGVRVVGKLPYPPTGEPVDPQVAALAATEADALLISAADPALQGEVLATARELGWLPRILLPSSAPRPPGGITSGRAGDFPAVYTFAIAKDPRSPAVSDDDDVRAYADAFGQFGVPIADEFTPECAWSYAAGAVLERAFLGMAEPTREAFLDALPAARGLKPPMLADGVVVEVPASSPVISGGELVQYDGAGLVPAAPLG